MMLQIASLFSEACIENLLNSVLRKRTYTLNNIEHDKCAKYRTSSVAYQWQGKSRHRYKFRPTAYSQKNLYYIYYAYSDCDKPIEPVSGMSGYSQHHDKSTYAYSYQSYGEYHPKLFGYSRKDKIFSDKWNALG